jgi:hypothetical protein
MINRITSARAVRKEFWSAYSELRRSRDRALVLFSFVVFVDSLQRDGLISDRLANSVTLEG